MSLNIISALRLKLENNSDEKIKESSQYFFKETILCYGIKTNIVHQIAKEFYQLIKNKPKEEIFELCETLWQSGYMEESFIACDWSYLMHKKYEPNDFKIFEQWINDYITNWASCDTFCNHTMGEFLEMYPQYLPELKKWALSSNRWVRRASAVSLIIPAKKGKFHREILELATILLTDKDDMVQKGYGWMLKVASYFDQKTIFNFVMKNKANMPRTALRYAIEKMPQELRKQAMSK
jgi:3-methyladenine DNA glycosylase AlkD